MKIYKHFTDYPMADWRWRNFSPREMASKGEGELAIDEDFMDRLQALRDRLNRPLLMTSAYRSVVHNRRVGGKRKSMHLKARAGDVRQENQDPSEFERAARDVGFTGFGFYRRKGFIHIDTGRPREWGRRWKAAPAVLLPQEPVSSVWRLLPWWQS